MSWRCPSGKQGFTSRTTARRLLARLQTGGRPVKRVYRCPECRDYHLTSTA